MAKFAIWGQKTNPKKVLRFDNFVVAYIVLFLPSFGDVVTQKLGFLNGFLVTRVYAKEIGIIRIIFEENGSQKIFGDI
jgi:hypothetical protein